MNKSSIDSIRINKYLSEAGVCSRREADRLVGEGKVTVNGLPARTGMRVTDADQILVNGKAALREEERILLLFNKPRGVECTAAKDVKGNVVDYIHYPKRVYPVGRLDKDSEGLLLLTNQGGLVNRLMRAGNRHEKEYVVTVNRPVTESFLDKMVSGVYLEELDVTTRPCEVRKSGICAFHIILTQGYNRQIRRMCAVFDYQVVHLKRIRILNLKVDGLRTGAYREATQEEQRALWEAIQDSSEEPVIESGCGKHSDMEDEYE